MNARRDEHTLLLAEQAEARRALTATPTPPTTRPRTRREPTNREAVLRRRLPLLPRHQDTAIHETVIDTILRSPQTSISSDRHGLRYLLSYAEWVRRTEGHFDPATQMDDARIDAWVEATYPEARETTANSARGALRKIRDQNDRRGTRRRTGRSLAPAPHTNAEWAHYEAVARSLCNRPVGQSLRMMLDLSGELGLRADEIIRADGHCIVNENDNISVIAINREGAVRIVPAFGWVAKRLAPLAGTTDLLVQPTMRKSRHNLVDAVLRQANRYSSGSLTGYSSIRARHRWLVNLMQQQISFTTLAALADINPGSHVLTDLLPHLPAIDPDHAAALLRARRIGGAR